MITREERIKRNARCNKIRRVRNRKLIFTHYGNKCAYCGQTNQVVLSIDHLNGGGAKHLRIIGRGDQFYTWIIKNNYPKDFQILCRNCNWAKGRGYIWMEELQKYIPL